MTRTILYISLILSSTGLAAVFAAAGNPAAALLALILAAAWAFAQHRGWPWFPAVGLSSIVALSGYGLWSGLSVFGMLASLVAGIMAWDSSHFLRRLGLAAPEDDFASLEKAHLMNLLIFGAVALALGSAAVLLRVRVSFIQSILLVLVGVTGLILLARQLRQKSTPPDTGH